MPRRCLLISFLAVAGLITPLTLSGQAPVKAEPGPAMWELMEQMGELLRQAKQAFNQPGGHSAAADLTHQLQALTLQAKAMTPPKIAEMPDNEARAEQLAAYRVAMIDVLRLMLDLEAACLANDKDKAFAVIDQIVDARFKGHIRFKGD